MFLFQLILDFKKYDEEFRFKTLGLSFPSYLVILGVVEGGLVDAVPDNIT